MGEKEDEAYRQSLERLAQAKRERRTIKDLKCLKEALGVLVISIPVLGYLAYLAAYRYELGFSAYFGFPGEFITVNWPAALNKLLILAGLAAILVLMNLAATRLEQSPLLKWKPWLMAFIMSLLLAGATLILFAGWYRYLWSPVWPAWLELWQTYRTAIWYIVAVAGIFLLLWYLLLLAPPNSKEKSPSKLVMFLKSVIVTHRRIIMVLLGIIIVLLLFYIIPYRLGETEASVCKGYWIPSPSTYPQSVVLRIYGDRLVCGGTLGEDNNTMTLNGNFFVIGPRDNLTFNPDAVVHPPS